VVDIIDWLALIHFGSHLLIKPTRENNALVLETFGSIILSSYIRIVPSPDADTASSVLYSQWLAEPRDEQLSNVVF